VARTELFFPIDTDMSTPTHALPPEHPSPEERFATYQDAEDYLNTFTDYERMERGVEYPEDLFDLRRIERLLESVENPHVGLRGIHLAGTKGKGSTALFAEAILRAHGLTTGLFTSPHLIEKEERIQVSGEALKPEEFLGWMNHLRPSLMCLKDTTMPPTFFDIVTTVGFLQFRSRHVEAAVLEVGLGGRLDSTNVFLPDVCILTRLGLDHTEKLGDTLDRIAFEKAGIIKPSRPVVSLPQEPEARAVIEEKCLETGSSLYWLGEDIRLETDPDTETAAFSVLTPRGRYPGLTLSVLGKHQRMNAAAAIAAAEIFMRQWKGAPLDPDLVRAAVARTRLPGRIEVLSDEPLLVVDGAHNPVAVEVLLQTVREGLSYQDLHVLFASSKDKDVRAMLAMLAPSVQRWTFTSFDFPRIEDPERLRETLGEVDPGAMCRVTGSPKEALDDAYGRSGPGDCILCCGSFYLVGEILKQIPGI
jgi:dihydrofolate synthase/folylpolyglutamate synthase